MAKSKTTDGRGREHAQYTLHNAKIEIHRYTNTQIHKCINTQIHKYTNTQIHKHTNTQIHKYTNTAKVKGFVVFEHRS